jgi:hypothetical protein
MNCVAEETKVINKPRRDFYSRAITQPEITQPEKPLDMRRYLRY